MTSYRVKRRAFLASLGGAFGFSSLLSNLEAAAEGAGSPPRFLMMYWPCGTIPYLFLPTGEGRTYVTSPILQPFETAGLRDDMSVLFGLKDDELTGGSGGHEGSIVMRTTGADIPGTRMNGGEGDDAVAGGPSFDQIFTQRVPQLASRSIGPINAICDARVDSQETSAQCLSYSYKTRSVDSKLPGGVITEHVPLMPETSPARLYTQLFSGFLPGGGTPKNRLELAQALQLRKSVLDYALVELERVSRLAPSSEREKIEAHEAAIRKVEMQLSDRLAGPLPTCAIPAAPDARLVAKVGSGSDYSNPKAVTADSDAVATLGKLHMSVIRAAFQCDLTRVATFQWSTGADQVAFQGLYPDDPDGAYMHHPLSHKLGGYGVDTKPANAAAASVAEFLGNVSTWYSQRTAELIAELKATQDIFGGSLLDSTIVPYVTDVAQPTHRRSPVPALIFGGRALGMQGGQFLDFRPDVRPFNDVWLSLAQAYFPDEPDLKLTLADEIFMQQSGSRLKLIPALWERPA